MSLSANVESILFQLRQSLSRKQSNTVSYLMSELNKLDSQNNGIMTEDEFSAALNKAGLFLKKSELWSLTKTYGAEGGIRNKLTRKLNWRNIMDQLLLRSERCTEFIQKLWNHITADNQDNEDSISIQQIFEHFTPSEHPEVKSGLITEERALEQLLLSIEPFGPNITEEKFSSACTGIALSAGCDDAFINLFSACFNVPLNSAAVDHIPDMKILMEEKLRQKQRGAESFQQTLSRFFKFFDKNGDGRVELCEFIQAFRKLGILLNHADLAMLFNSIDTNGDGVVDYDEFITMFLD